MNSVPTLIDGAEVICVSPLDSRHHPTGTCRHFRDGVLQTSFAAVAICQYKGKRGVYLFYCDENWETMNDTFHDTLEDALAQAESEFQGVSKTWQLPRA